MHTVKFHNIGNADCTLIDLDNGRKLLFDYAHMGTPDDEHDLRCDLPREIRDALGSSNRLDVLAFTHLDKDHYLGATDIFYFDHINEYQASVDGEARIRFAEMWIPAAVITEALSKDADYEAKAIQKEARERFKANSGIRVYSAPKRLKVWCERNGVDYEKRKHLVTDAGQLAPGFSINKDGVEFFVHSPFAMRQDECTVEDRNNDALVMHATFKIGDRESKLFLASDVKHDVLTDIVTVTEKKANRSRLEWDIFKLPHHCSHHSLSGAPREGDKSVPEPKVKRLFENYGLENCVVVSTSDPIPNKGSDQDKKGANPPHRQAATYYQDEVVVHDQDFKVTMEHPSESDPSPLMIEIDGHGPTVKKVKAAAAFVATTSRAPRAG